MSLIRKAMQSSGAAADTTLTHLSGLCKCLMLVAHASSGVRLTCLACGAKQLLKKADYTPVWCPRQLARKYAPELFPHGVVVPVVRSVLADFDVVYAPLITSYGSCSGAPARDAPSTESCPGDPLSCPCLECKRALFCVVLTGSVRGAEQNP